VAGVTSGKLQLGQYRTCPSDVAPGWHIRRHARRDLRRPRLVHLLDQGPDRL